MSLLVKICGLKTPESVECAVATGADMVGLNFFPRSPRYVTPEAAKPLAAFMRGNCTIVALTVDVEDAEVQSLAESISPDLWQFHGREVPGRIATLRAVTRRPVMKALGIAERADIESVFPFATVTDHLLLDAKPPRDAAYPGGHGKVFDWSILSALPPDLPFMLSGGLSPENVGEAIRTIRAMGLSLAGVDVSSGVETAPGVKDLGKIRAFVAAAREADGV